MREKKDYLKDYILIPKQILQKNMTPRACLLYGLIYKLSATTCYATNKWFSKELNCNERTINNLLNELEKEQCIKIRYDETNPNIRYLTPLITNEVKLDNSKKSGFGDNTLDNYYNDFSNGGFEEL